MLNLKGEHMLQSKLRITLTIFFILIFSSLLLAQSSNVKSITDRAVRDYQSGNYTSAINGMERALDIMKNKQSNEYQKLLPQILPGWTRGESSSRPVDPRGIEDGRIVEQTYNKGRGYVTVTLLVNAPMVNDVKKMLSNSQGTTNRTGYSYELIANKRSLVRYYDNQNKGEITILAGNNAVAAVFGQNVTLREMKNYARLFKFSEINKLK